MNRRKFIQAGAASALLAGSGSFLYGSRSGQGADNGKGKARNVIFLVTDGMSAGTLSFVDQFIRWRDGRSSHWIRLYEEGIARRGLMDTASLDSIVTDSAAAAVAWSCGKRVNNGSVNIGPDGTEYRPILPLATEAGKATGLITTATVTHATPAAFAANVPHRGREPEIAEQYFDRKFDLILGGGQRFFEGDKRDDGRDLAGEFVEAGYHYARTAEEFRKVVKKDDPILGLLFDGHLPYELDRLNDDGLKEAVPSLAEMTKSGLDYLNRRPNGFVVQIEGARVDHAAHSNDIGGLVFDQIAFDDAIGVVDEFVKENPDTLVIITTDHGNANPGLNSGNNEGENNFSTLNAFNGTHAAILGRIGKDSSLEEIRDVIADVTGVGVSHENAELLKARFNEEFRMPYGRMNGISAVLGQILANDTDIGWIGHTHTSDHVELAAFGPGSESLKPFQKNTELFGMMVDALGIETGPTAGI